MVKIQDTSAQDFVIAPKVKGKAFWIKWSVIGLVGTAIAWVLIGAIGRLLSTDITVSRDRLRFSVVERGTFTRDVTAQGKVIAAISPTLYSSADGTVTLNVIAGDTVERGQVLAVIESPVLKNLYAQEKATLDSTQVEVSRQRIQTKKSLLKGQQTIDLAKVKLVAAEREKQRAELSIEKQVISRIDYEKAKDDLDAAKVEYKHAVQDTALDKESLEFELKTKELQLDRQKLLVDDLERQVNELEVRSPVSGIIGNVAIQQKEAVARNAPLMTVVDLSVYEVEVNIPESYADDLGIGMKTEITFNQVKYTGELTAISPEVISNQVTARMRFAGESPDNLRQNQRVTTRILIENKEGILKVRRGAFLDSSAGRYAYRVEDNIATRVPIEVGSRGISELEIMSGLKEGESIVISNTDLFSDAEVVYLTN